jgi:hypothetical protein
MSGGYNAKTVRPNGYKIQTQSGGFQKPFFFGGAQTPTALHIHPDSYSGASGSGLKRSAPTTNLHKIKLFLPK